MPKPYIGSFLSRRSLKMFPKRNLYVMQFLSVAKSTLGGDVDLVKISILARRRKRKLHARTKKGDRSGAAVKFLLFF